MRRICERSGQLEGSGCNLRLKRPNLNLANLEVLHVGGAQTFVPWQFLTNYHQVLFIHITQTCSIHCPAEGYYSLRIYNTPDTFHIHVLSMMIFGFKFEC